MSGRPDGRLPAGRPAGRPDDLRPASRPDGRTDGRPNGPPNGSGRPAQTARLTARTARLTAPHGGASARRLRPFSLTKSKIMTHLRLQVWGIQGLAIYQIGGEYVTYISVHDLYIRLPN